MTMNNILGIKFCLAVKLTSKGIVLGCMRAGRNEGFNEKY